MKDNFDLKKFLKENKSLENLNSIVSKENLNENSLRSKIREMILAELGNPEYSDFDEMKDEYTDEDTYYAHTQDLEDEELENPLMDKFDYEDDLYEAKKDKEEETEEVEVEDTEEVAAEDAPEGEDTPAEDAPEGEAGLEDVAADMEGTEGELMNHLMSSLKVAKGLNNDKLTTQIGNTVKFFVSTYIGGEEENA